jgi:endonuclease/exonuclease/phosphatase family metal-dependent hydrolase
MRSAGGSALLVLGLAAAGCGHALTAVDLTDPAGPRAAGAAPGPARGGETLRVVSFNIAYAQNVAGAIDVLRAPGPLRDPDVLLLQEMDLKGVREVAAALKLGYVYYPAARHPRKMKKDTAHGISRADPEYGYFGVGLLSPWPLEDDQKILLGRGQDSALKVAVAATLRWRDRPVRVVGVHLPTPLGKHFETELRGLVSCVLEGRCEEPTRAVPPGRWADGERPGNFVFAGDFNSSGREQLEAIGRVFAGRGEEVAGLRSTYNTYRLRVLPRWLSFDHIVHGSAFAVVRGQSGVVPLRRAVSDHRPVWAVLELRRAEP